MPAPRACLALLNGAAVESAGSHAICYKRTSRALCCGNLTLTSVLYFGLFVCVCACLAYCLFVCLLPKPETDLALSLFLCWGNLYVCLSVCVLYWPLLWLVHSCLAMCVLPVALLGVAIGPADLGCGPG